MNTFIAISLIIFGFLVLMLTFKDGRKRKIELTTSLIMHLKGYVGGFILVIIGLIKLMKSV